METRYTICESILFSHRHNLLCVFIVYIFIPNRWVRVGNVRVGDVLGG